MFGKKIPLISLLLLSSKALAQIPTAFTAGFDPSTVELVITYDGPGDIKDGETLTANETNTVPQFGLGDSSAISPSTNYIILMIDPDSPMRTDGTSKQVLHFMKADFSVKELTELSSVSSAPAVPYVGPAASVGTGLHRYIFLLYVQPGGFTNKLLPQSGSRDFNVSAWSIGNNLKPAVAGVHFVALPGGGGASVASSAAGGALTATTAVKSSAVTPPPCSSTAMRTSTSVAAAPAVGITTNSAAPSHTTLPGTVTLIASPPTASSPAASSVAPAPAAGATHLIKVGGPNALLTYQPSMVNASVGDVIRFDFLQKNHTVTQSTFDSPCAFNPAGVNSGFRPNSNGTEGKEFFEFTVPNAQPQWFFCAQAGHCKAGMVFAVNPGTKFPAYLAKATGGAASSAPYPSTLVPTGTGGVATATRNTTAPGATGAPVFQGAAPRGVTVGWPLAGIVGLLVFFL